MTLRCAGDFYVSDGVFDLYDDLLVDIRVPSVLQQAAIVACRTLCAERSTVYLLRENTRELESHGAVGDVPQSIRIPIEHASLAGHCALTGEAFKVDDAYGNLTDIHPELGFDKSWDEAMGFRTRGVMCAPALFRGHLVGVVQVVNSTTDGFQIHQLSDLESIGRLLGYALESARAFEDLATMKELKKRNSQFMRVLVHELKAPVATVRMMVDLFRENLVPDEKKPSTYNKLSVRLDGLLDMISDILDLSQVQAGVAMGKIGIIDFAQVVQKGSETHREQAEAKGIGFALTIEDAPLPVRFDDKGSELVVSNLLSNAVKYTSTGSVEVLLERRGDKALLEVRDSGIGIPKNELPNLFQEFYRTSNAKRAHIEGTGVGLAAVKDIVERFGGHITIDSEEDVGTTLSVLLPLT